VSHLLAACLSSALSFVLFPTWVASHIPPRFLPTLSMSWLDILNNGYLHTFIFIHWVPDSKHLLFTSSFKGKNAAHDDKGRKRREEWCRRHFYQLKARPRECVAFHTMYKQEHNDGLCWWLFGKITEKFIWGDNTKEKLTYIYFNHVCAARYSCQMDVHRTTRLSTRLWFWFFGTQEMTGSLWDIRLRYFPCVLNKSTKNLVWSKCHRVANWKWYGIRQYTTDILSKISRVLIGR